MHSLIPLTLLLAPLTHALPSPPQIPFRTSSAKPLFNPSPSSQSLVKIQHTSSLIDGSDSFTLTHAHLPHRVRAVRPKICDNVDQWSGYLDTPRGHHLYFWFFASRSDPVNDPLALWLNGGPGCSSFTGLLQELGPCAVEERSPTEGKLKWNPYSWTNNASYIFLDQPVGVGYSYADEGDPGVWNTAQAAVDVHAFLQIWLEAFPDLRSNAFHISGESYAGRYIPLFADYIVHENKRDNGLPPINLTSVLIGNGMTSPKIQYGAYYPAACTNATGYGPWLANEQCDAMATSLPKCQQMIQACYDNPSNSTGCQNAKNFCEDTQAEPFYGTGRNAFDVEKFGDYIEETWINTFLNIEKIKHALGVDHEPSGGVRKYIDCSDQVGEQFAVSGEGTKRSDLAVADLLENGVAVLAYSGRRDFICNWIGNEQWTLALEWSGHAEYSKLGLSDWFVPSSYENFIVKPKVGSESGEGVEVDLVKEKGPVGQYRSYGNLTFAIVDDSGHFVPYDRPLPSLVLATTWMHAGPASFREILGNKDA